MDMEGEEGTAVKSTSTTPPYPAVAAGTSASSRESGSWPTASATDEGEGDEGRQVKVPGQEEGDDGGGGVAVSDDDDDGRAEPLSNANGDDDDGWSTVSENDPIEGQAGDDDDDTEEDDSSLGSIDDVDTEDDTDTTSDEGDPGEDDDDETHLSNGGDSSGTRLESAGDVEQASNPMKNPVILKHLFELCPPQLLAKFRLVCKEWRDLSMKDWRSSFTLRFYNTRGKVQLRVVDDDQELGEIPLKDFLKFVDNPKNQCQLKPFRRYDLTVGFKFPLEESKSVRIRKLWELVKRDATFLELCWCSFPRLEVFREVIYKDLMHLQHLNLHCCQIGKEVPSASQFPFSNLEQFKGPAISVAVYPEHLNLKSLSIELEDEIVEFPLDWLELFSQFPALTRLSMAIATSDDDSRDRIFQSTELLRVLEAIQAVRKKDHRKLPLKEFDVRPYLEASQDDKLSLQVMGLLRDLRLPLQSLKVWMESKKKRKVQKLGLDIDGSTLRYLDFHQLDCGFSTWKFPFNAPLENLSELVMADFIWENMEFLKLTPNLKKLEIMDFNSPYPTEPRNKSVPIISKTQKHKMTDVKLPTMKDFEWDFTLTEDELRHLGNWFPNLTKLKMTLDDKLFRIVCEQWLDLESILVDGGELTDQGITGLAEGQVVEDLDTMELPPNIRLLQNLKYIRYLESEKISDVSIFNGFVKLPHLRDLRLGQGLSEKAKAAVMETRRIRLFSENNRGASPTDCTRK